MLDSPRAESCRTPSTHALREDTVSADTPASSTDSTPAGHLATTVRRTLATYLERPIGEIDLDSRLELDLELDSFAMIEITIALETALGFSMEDVADPQDLNLVTVGDLVDYVSSRLAAQQAEEAGDAPTHDR